MNFFALYVNQEIGSFMITVHGSFAARAEVTNGSKFPDTNVIIQSVDEFIECFPIMKES